MTNNVDVDLRAVAGCLFELSLPADDARNWRYLDAGDGVTLMADEARSMRHHFRFRAEAPGADVGAVELRFRRGDDVEAAVTVRIASERWVR